MPPILASLLWFFLLLALFCLDPAKPKKVSPTLWIPVIWMFILASRSPSLWLGLQAGLSAQAYEEGNPLDHVVFFALLFSAFGILQLRAFDWPGFFRRNLALTTFLCFTIVSLLWSDLPLVALKRWFRGSGDYLVILVVLSDPRPVEAVRIILRRVSYLLIPLSILLIKYYPELAKAYDEWTGIATYTGATTSKNMLGIVCLISGIFFFWDTVVRWSRHMDLRTKRILLVNISFIAMTLWLLHTCNSATSQLCLVIGCLVVMLAHRKAFRRRPAILQTMLPTALLLYVILAFGLGLQGSLASSVGRDPTLTGRTKIWKIVLSMHTNPLLGAGYESFWLGPRLEKIWRAGEGTVNESHNGYLEVYLNLGIIGACLLLGFVITGYRNICKRLRPFTEFGSLTLSIWTVFLFHNFTEADFRTGPMWLVFLVACMAVRNKSPGKSPSLTDKAEFASHVFRDTAKPALEVEATKTFQPSS